MYNFDGITVTPGESYSELLWWKDGKSIDDARYLLRAYGFKEISNGEWKAPQQSTKNKRERDIIDTHNQQH